MAAPMVIEARLNEYARRDANPNVPFSEAEIVADALACAAAGAASVHFHARDALTGAPLHEPDAYARIIRAIRARSDMLIHPTLGYAAHGGDAAARFAVIEHLCRDPATRPDFMPLDMGSANVDPWDAAQGDYESRGAIYANPTPDLEHFARRGAALGVAPYLVSWNAGFSRQIGQFMQLGLVREPACVCLAMTEGRIVAAHPGTPRGLLAHLDLLPPGRRIEWTACVVGGNVLPIAAMAAAMGGHVAAGLGDHPYLELGAAPSNADVVRRLAALA